MASKRARTDESYTQEMLFCASTYSVTTYWIERISRSLDAFLVRCNPEFHFSNFDGKHGHATFSYTDLRRRYLGRDERACPHEFYRHEIGNRLGDLDESEYNYRHYSAFAKAWSRDASNEELDALYVKVTSEDDSDGSDQEESDNVDE
jgi:hypothetical protein